MAADITLEFFAQLEGLAAPHLNLAFAKARKLGLVVMQSTGLKDRNRIELYDADVLRDENGDLFEIRWNSAVGAFWLYEIGDHVAKNPDCSKMVRVGNRYENPELIPSSATSTRTLISFLRRHDHSADLHRPPCCLAYDRLADLLLAAIVFR